MKKIKQPRSILLGVGRGVGTGEWIGDILNLVIVDLIVYS